MSNNLDHVIAVEAAGTLDGLFRERVKRTPEGIAYRDYNQQHANWRDYTWAQINHQVARWQAALERDGLAPGERVAILLRNCREWVMFDQAGKISGCGKVIGVGIKSYPIVVLKRG